MDDSLSEEEVGDDLLGSDEDDYEIEGIEEDDDNMQLLDDSEEEIDDEDEEEDLPEENAIKLRQKKKHH